jgi:hypothetical protein
MNALIIFFKKKYKVPVLKPSRLQSYMKSAGEKTAIQSSTDGIVWPYFTVTHSVSSPC